MKVYDDFFSYKSGVYSHTGLGTSRSSTHSVRVVGWGEDTSLGSRPQKYWVISQLLIECYSKGYSIINYYCILYYLFNIL